ncbi:hypothetical protein BDZ97DRAFT_1915215 [Flammula alnicola]|nr:hypothetical protein BDZ97DRAFT_1915215 [Flammula alnicola]
MPPHIPQDIYDEVVSHLWGDDDALQACSLTCRAFLPSCQRFLFSNIVLFPPTRNFKKFPNGHHLQQLLKASPHLCRYVHYLEVIDCYIENEWLSHDRTLIFCLPLLCSLKGLAIRYRAPVRGGNWEGIAQGGLLGALLDIMQLPSLIYLSFQSLPLVMVNHCPNLKHLIICCLTTDSVMGYSSMHDDSAKSVYLDTLKVQFLDSHEPMSSNSMSPTWFSDTINNTALNVTKLKKLHAYADGNLGTHHDMWMLLKLCAGSLEELVFRPAMWIDEAEASSMDPIEWSILTNLKIFSTFIKVFLDEGDAFPWFISMLRKQSVSGSSIEEYVVQVNYDLCGSDVDLSCWKEVIDLISSRNRFPRLRKLHILIHCCNRNKEEIVAELEQFFVELTATRQEVDCQVRLVDEPSSDFDEFPPDITYTGLSFLDF